MLNNIFLHFYVNYLIIKNNTSLYQKLFIINELYFWTSQRVLVLLTGNILIQTKNLIYLLSFHSKRVINKPSIKWSLAIGL